MKINEVFSKIPTWLGSASQDYDVMYAVTRAFQVKRILEIGTHQGASAIVFCQAILDNKYVPEIWTIDNWSSSKCKPRAEKFIREAGFDKHIKMLDGDSKVVVPNLFKKIGKVDLCFIDGDHTYEGVIADYNNCKNSTSLILFHDTHGGRGEIVNKYLSKIKEDGWMLLNFPTMYLEGDGHSVGITLAHK